MVKRFAFAVPGDLATPTGGYAYDRRMIVELGDLGWQVDLLDLGEGFPWPSEATRTAALTQLLSMPAGRAIVVDIARAHEVLKAALVPLNYHNLDELPQFKGINTTTEFLTRHLFDHLADAARAGKLGRDGRELKSIRVTVAESPVARAWYEAALW